LLVRRELLQQLGGFTEAMRLGEDVDFIWRAIKAGTRVHYAPEGHIIHRHRVRLGAWLRRRAEYGSSEADLQQRHPAGRRLMIVPLTGLLFLGGLSLAGVWGPLSIICWGGVVLRLGLEFRQKRQQLRQLGLRLPAGFIVRAILQAHGAALYHLGSNVIRYYSLPLLLTCLIAGALIPAAALLLLLPPLVDYRRLRPQLVLPLFIGLYFLELTAYQIGVWVGCLRWRTLQPLWSRLKWGR
jgi:hypothetical protein